MLAVLSHLTEASDRASNTTTDTNMDKLTVQTEDSFFRLLEFAADNNLEGFKTLQSVRPFDVSGLGLWYCRRKGSKQIVLDQRTPLMVAATYGSVDVLRFILSQTGIDVNFSCGMDKITALHCVASGGSNDAIAVVQMLLKSGADLNLLDSNGCRPIDLLVVHPKLSTMRPFLESMLSEGASDVANGIEKSNLRNPGLDLNLISSSCSSSPENESAPLSSPWKAIDVPATLQPEKKEYPFDPSLPDIKNSIYSTDEFRMYSFKVRPCSRAYSHDWTECPFVHPGENARRRDPRKFHYSCVPCPEFHKGTCRRGDICEYAHGVFECWLHPAQYRTRLCKDGTSCNRRVCFFAHTHEELRPLYVSSGSVVPSPRSSATVASVMDMAAALSLFPGSPSVVSSMSPIPFTKAQSPPANGISHQGPWPQAGVPTLHLPGSNLQSSRLRSSLNARDMFPEDVNLMAEMDAQHQILNDLSCYSQGRNSLSRSGRMKLTPSNLEDLFAAEHSSPRYGDQGGGVFSPSHKSAVLSQFQQQQALLSPINTNVFSPKSMDHPFLQSSFGVGSPGRMSPRGIEPISPMSSRLSAFAQREKQLQQFRSLSSRELGSNNIGAPMVGSPVSSWSRWGSPTGQADWSMNGDDMHKYQRTSVDHPAANTEEPDVSWVQSLVKESPEMMEKKFKPVSVTSSVEKGNLNIEIDSVIESWLEQMQMEKQQVVV